MNELNKKINECNGLYEELAKRPIRVVRIADFNSYENHAERSSEIKRKLKTHELHHENIKIKDSAVRVQVVASEDLIFYGIVVKHLVGKCKVNVNDLIQFQSCDCINMQEVN